MRPLPAILLLTAVLLAAGCGYVGEPLPPALNIPQKVADFKAVERGAQIVLEFTVPELTTEGLVLKRVGRVDARIGPGGAPPFDVERWAAGATVVPVSATEPGFVTVETPAQPWAGQEVVLGVRTSHLKGRLSAWSNLVALPVVEPLAIPAKVHAEAVPRGVRLSWQAVARPGLAFRIFRTAASEEKSSLAARVEALEWVDGSAQFGKRYRYSLQAVLRSGESEAESDVSTPVEITPVDTFPPATPAGLTAVAAPQSIELAWERNTEADLAGYRLYRSVDGSAYEKVADSLDAPAYSDHKIQPGKRYRYAVAAVDQLANQSLRSEPVEIVAP